MNEYPEPVHSKADTPVTQNQRDYIASLNKVAGLPVPNLKRMLKSEASGMIRERLAALKYLEQL